ncbi:MAG TPA: glutaredoxin [Dehalococcoidia bacterium]|nr:glutaredoxin [Dehalococcoidia bacterium]
MVIYSTSTYPYCKRAKDYISRKGSPYTDINVAQDRDTSVGSEPHERLHWIAMQD